MEPTTTQVLEWYDQRSPHTKAYDTYLLKQAVNSTIEDVSLRENVGYDADVGAVYRHMTPVDWEQIDDSSTFGNDEVAMSKGRKNYAAIITTRQKDGKVRILWRCYPTHKNNSENLSGTKYRHDGAQAADPSPPTCGRRPVCG